MKKHAVIHQRLVDMRKQIREIHDAVAGGASALDLIGPIGEVLGGLDTVQRLLDRERLRVLEKRIGTKRSTLSAPEERELRAILTILKPWEQRSLARHGGEEEAA